MPPTIIAAVTNVPMPTRHVSCLDEERRVVVLVVRIYAMAVVKNMAQLVTAAFVKRLLTFIIMLMYCKPCIWEPKVVSDWNILFFRSLFISISQNIIGLAL